MAKQTSNRITSTDTQKASLSRYNLSFTAASLRPELARIIAENYLSCYDWDVAKQKVLKNNALQSRTTSSAVRIERELRQRIQTLTVPQIEILASAPSDSRTAIAWLSMLKASAFVFDFASEVVRAKLEALDYTLRPSDYETFFTMKGTAHPELLSLSPTSKTKIRNVLLSMMREAGLLNPSRKDNTLCRPVIPHDVQSAMIADDRRWLAGFLVPDNENFSTRGLNHAVRP